MLRQFTLIPLVLSLVFTGTTNCQMNTGKANPDRVIVTVQVRCQGEYAYRKVTGMLGPIVVSDEPRVVRQFPIRLEVKSEVENKTHDATLDTHEPGKPDRSTVTLDLWSGDFGQGSKDIEFTLRLLQKKLPESSMFPAPKVPNPDDPNDGYFETGTVSVTLKYQNDVLVVVPSARANASLTNEGRFGPTDGIWEPKFKVQPPKLVPFALVVRASRAGDVTASKKSTNDAAPTKLLEPVEDRVSRLEAENKRLRDELARLKPQLPFAQNPPVAKTPPPAKAKTAADDVALSFMSARNIALDGDEVFVVNRGNRTVVVTVSSKRSNENNPFVQEIELLAGQSKGVGHTGGTVRTTFSITGARYQ